MAPPYFSNGPHIGPAAINRNDVNVYAQDTWKITPHLTARLRIALGAVYAHHRARPPHLGFLDVTPPPGRPQEYVINPQPGYQTG